MTDVLINHVGWVDVPEASGHAFLNGCALWDMEDQLTLEALLPRYGYQRTAWALGRSVEAVKARAFKTAAPTPGTRARACADKRGGV